MEVSKMGFPRLKIEIVKNNSQNYENKELLDLFLNNYRRKIKLDYNYRQTAQNLILDLTLFNFEDHIQRHEMEMKILRLILKTFVQEGKERINRFDFIEKCTELGNPDHYLVVKYETNVVELLKDFYKFLNYFTYTFDILFFIEETANGFLFYFNRKKALEYFVIDVLSPENIEIFQEDKQVAIPDEFYEKIIDLVNRRENRAHS